MAQLALILGTAITVGGTLAQGKAAEQNSKFQQAQLRQAAKDEEASAALEAAEERRQSQLIQSRARAVGASSGAGEYEGVIEELDAEGEYRALFALFNGERAATNIRNQAAITGWEGQQEKKSSQMRAAGTLLDYGNDTMARKYGGESAGYR